MAKIDDNLNNDLNNFISVRGCNENNLKNVNIDIPKHKFVVITGPSGSGKSSLAFDTIYAEGQRRYIGNLSSYAQMIIGVQKKPNVESIKGLTPAIAIDQKTTSKNPRSTVGTITEIYDTIRVMFSKVGKVFSPTTEKQLFKYTKPEIVSLISTLPLGTKIRILAPIIRNKKGTLTSELIRLQKQKHEKVRIDKKFYPLTEEIPQLDETKEHTIDVILERIIIKQNIGTRIKDAVEKCLEITEDTIILNIVEFPEGQTSFTLNKNIALNVGDYFYFSTKYTDPESSFTLESTEPKMFSFNLPFGTCPSCHGLGTEVFFKEDLIVPDEMLSLSKGAIEPWNYDNPKYKNKVLVALSEKYGFSLEEPYKDLPEKIKKLLMYGGKDEEVEITYEESMRTIKRKVPFIGVINEMKAKLENCDDETLLMQLEKYQNLTKCHVCNGHRLKKEILQIKINNKNIGDVCDMSLTDVKKWLEELPKNLEQDEAKIVEQIIKEAVIKITYLIDIGLGYLTLSRSANTLSGGEAQRIRLATQIGTSLCDITYVLDEPSIGLHQSDNDKLIATLKTLRDHGNSVIVIEHDEETIKNADYLVDIGPGAGKYGGEVIDCGMPNEVAERKKGMTGLFLSGATSIPTPKAHRKYGNREFIEITGCCENNLKNVNLKLPLGKFIAVSGVSGGGKSTLILDTLYTAIAQQKHRAKTKPGKFKELKGLENIDKVIKIDQDQIGRTPRSNPATYTGIFTLIRDLYTALPESIIRGYKSGRFSTNVSGGRCENCQGDGMTKIEMQLLPDTYVVCPACNGRRYNQETLEIKYKGLAIDEVLNLSVREAMDVFKDEIIISEKLKTLYNVGLDYLKLGQRATTLSGGEAQRIHLAKELSRKATGNTLYILDEPTTGLHSCDIKQLLEVLNTLVDYGNTVLVIEHNLDVIKTADHVIDIGPVGGELGGYIVAEGTPQEVAENPNSITGKYLKRVMK